MKFHPYGSIKIGNPLKCVKIRPHTIRKYVKLGSPLRFVAIVTGYSTHLNTNVEVSNAFSLLTDFCRAFVTRKLDEMENEGCLNDLSCGKITPWSLELTVMGASVIIVRIP